MRHIIFPAFPRRHSPEVRLTAVLPGVQRGLQPGAQQAEPAGTQCRVQFQAHLALARHRAGWVRLIPADISRLTASLAERKAAGLRTSAGTGDAGAAGDTGRPAALSELLTDGRVAARRLAIWSYVLQAVKVPHLISRNQEVLVPVLYAQMATRHLAEYEYELAHPKRPHLPVSRPLASLTFLLLLPLLLVHVLCSTDVLPMGLPHPEGWPQGLRQASELFGMDNVRVRIFGEWSRAVTALFVHADPGHLAANAAFSLIFCRILAGHTGPGLALFLTIWAGALGNVLTLPLREGYVLSVGFSTALFACIGATSGFVACISRPSRISPGALLPLACGAALLALLGTEGENTDYTAHLCGLAAGMGSGWCAALLTQTRPVLWRAGWQLALACAALALPLAAFWVRLG